MHKNNWDELKQELKKVKEDFKSIKTVYKQIPNMITTSRILATIPINILFFNGHILSAFILSCITFVTDAFDGFIARKLHAESKLGADLDALCDKLLIGGISIPMIILNPVMTINIILEGLISIPNIKAKKNGEEPKSSYIGKIKTWILSLTVLAGYIVALLNINLSIFNSLLAIIPAVGMQIATLVGYLNKEKEKKDLTLHETLEATHLNLSIDKPKNNVKQKELVYGPATLEELKALKQELIIPYNELNYSKVKNRFN